MSDYTQVNNFGAKDDLPAGATEKTILGADWDDEFAAISTAIATKYDSGDLASQADAEGGTEAAKLLTPLRFAQFAAASKMNRFSNELDQFTLYYLSADVNCRSDVTSPESGFTPVIENIALAAGLNFFRFRTQIVTTVSTTSNAEAGFTFSVAPTSWVAGLVVSVNDSSNRPMACGDMFAEIALSIGGNTFDATESFGFGMVYMPSAGTMTFRMNSTATTALAKAGTYVAVRSIP